MNYFAQKTEAEIATLTTTLAKQKTTEEKALEAEVLSNQQRMKDFPALLSSHKVATEFFRRLEGLTSPKIMFTQLQFNPVDGAVTLSGQADSFESLGQQFLSLKNATDAIQQARITKISLNTEGKVEFSFLILLDPSVISYNQAE